MKINFLFLVCALIAEVIGTIGGFGSSVFFVPLGSFFFDFHTILGLTAVFHLSSNVSKIVLFLKGFNKQLILYIGIPSVLFVIIGGFLSKYLDKNFLEGTLGVFLIVFSLIFLLKKDLVIPPKKSNSIFGGMISGFTAGLLGTGGAVRGLTMAAFDLEKSVFVATSAYIDFAVDLSRTFVYYGNGYITKQSLLYIPWLLGIGLAGTFLGQQILRFIPQDRFKQLSLVMILLIGLISLIKLLIKSFFI